MKKIFLIVAALVATFTFSNAQPAQALGWSTLHNLSSTGHSILISSTDPYVYSSTLYPGYGNDRVSCFRPTEDMHSQYGGVYYAYTTRCFSSSGNTLALYSGRS